MRYILGIDEAGRGAWAGPLVVGAVILGDFSLEGLTDSKLLTPNNREKLALRINAGAISATLGWVSPAEIDKLGLTKATSLAIKRAIEGIKLDDIEIVIDGNINYLPELEIARCQIKADLIVPEVSAASIVAKVARDEYMKNLALKLPGFGFENHVGYGTKSHAASLDKLGVCTEHRRSFKPVSVFV